MLFAPLLHPPPRRQTHHLRMERTMAYHRRHGHCTILEEGHFPQTFKAAKTVMLPKPGKRDLTQLSSWRPISLLSTLDKGLEYLLTQ